LACDNCGKDLPIINKKYNLCTNCNSIRLTGKSLQERQVESSSKYRQKYVTNFCKKVTRETDELDLSIPLPKKSFKVKVNIKSVRKFTPIRQQTKKEAVVKSHLSIMKRDIELEAVQNNEYYCKGCGKSHVGLDKSHILSVGQFKQYELIKANIQLMCRGCHRIWESGTIEEQVGLLCFIDNLQFIYTLEPLVFQKFITRIEEYKVWLIEEKDQDKIRVINEILQAVEV
jgi:hypothetical protein